jgi:alkanesulfonate monooxygenase SsuD/methylene tetrahydromethanopterin reductase-like flavin-dependent oxidoreductase (luciferase family)
MRRSSPRGQMHLGAFFHPTGHHVASWLHPDAQADAGTNFGHYVQLAQMSEAAKFDLMFLADALAVRDGNLEALSRWPQYMAYFEPITLLSGIAGLTERIGLVATATTSYNEPYNVARKFASLDMISGGRAGWNVVTSGNLSEAFNFGREAHYEHGERYDRALEFVDVVQGLWDSWDEDAFLRDRGTERYFDPAKLHTLNHKGEHFSVRGPLNVARSPQGQPVIFQAGLNPIVGRTEQEAEDKHQYLQSLIHPDVGLELLSNALAGFDLRPYDIDGPLPKAVYSVVPKGGTTSFHNVLRWAEAENLSIRQLYERYAGARGQRTVKGTGAQIADQMEEWFVNYGVDGFLIQPSHLPGGLGDFIEQVIPELQERGLSRTEYEGATLRDHLGLSRPRSRYA